MFHQSINLPLIIESVDLKKLDLNEIFNRHNLTFKKIFILTGGKNSHKFAKKIYTHNQEIILKVHTNNENSIEFIQELKSEVYGLKADAIIGVGGGQVLDTAKYLATKTKLPYFAVPTVVSSDALASPIAILKTGDKTKGFSCAIPSGILIDYQVISECGDNPMLSGVGDIISNMSAVNDWDIAVKAGKAKANNFARFLSEVSVSNLLSQSFDSKDLNFMKTYINSIIISGLAMNISGDSRPCSGSEHLMSHALDALNLNKFSHGISVGSLTPFCLYLQNDNRYKLFKDDKYKFLKVDLIEPKKITEIYELAKVVRGNRYTVLNLINRDEIKYKYNIFIKLKAD